LLLAMAGHLVSCSAEPEATPAGAAIITTVFEAPSGQPPATLPALPSISPGATPTPSRLGSVTLNAVGDLMLERDIITLMDMHGSAWPYDAVRHLLADADITIGNMEGTFSERGVADNKLYTFRTPPRHAAGLAQAGFDVVSLANNHAMDYGDVALADTLAALDAAGVRHSGAGENAAAARRPVVLETNGLRIAFLSYNAVTESTPAGPSSPGVAWGDEPTIRADVAAARQLADLVVVSLHAGTEYVDAPSGVQRQLGRAAIDAGAALVLGHHAHVFQGWQRYGQGVFVLGLGNFVFDLDFDDYQTLGPRPFQTAVLHIELTGEGVTKVEARPVFIDPAQNRPVVPDGETLRAIEARIEMLNAALQ
jgi:poly-gamma-glutamate synthesis protein (capsule biosynthesis protein)